ncbi:MAG: hypothetical protein OEZ34_13440 [Spirochaetia bacterium]|nr:hypothetical protein [Spirochaetia bacterium]
MFCHCSVNRIFSKRYFTYTLFFFISLIFFEPLSSDPNPPDNSQKDQKSIEQSSGISEEIDSPWEDPDFTSDFPELQILEDIGGKKSMEYMSEAEKLFKEALKTLRGIDDKVKTRQEEQIVDKIIRFEWEKIEEKDRLRRIERKVQLKNRMKALGLIIEALEYLEKIKNPTLLKSENYASLESKILREYIKLQYQSGNYTQSIHAIEKYFAIKESHKNEPEPHKILAICYDKQANMAEKAGDTKHKNIFTYKKNIHMLKYAEIAYGKESKEYESLKKHMINPVYIPEE